VKVIHFDLGRTFRGGQRQLHLLAAEQRRRGGQPTVVTASPRLADLLTTDDIPAVRVGPNPLLALPRLRRLVGASDLVHAHDARAHGLVRTLSSRRPIVVHRRIDDPPRDRVTTRWKYAAGDFVCVSAAVSEALGAFGVPSERRHVVHSGVPEAPAAVPAVGQPSSPLRLVALGALVPHKGHADLLAALEAVPDVTLDIVGDGPLRASLESSSVASRVRFLGDPRGRLPDWSAYDLLVHPSRTEGLGTAVLDAQAAGLPVLATRAGGLPEAVSPDGWLVAPRSPDALAAGLGDVLSRRAELPARGRRARAWVRGRFSIARMADGVDAVYARVSSTR